MWVEELPNGKFKYFERYKDPLTEKWKKVSITLEKCSRQAEKKAQAYSCIDLQRIMQALCLPITQKSEALQIKIPCV